MQVSLTGSPVGFPAFDTHARLERPWRTIPQSKSSTGFGKGVIVGGDLIAPSADTLIRSKDNVRATTQPSSPHDMAHAASPFSSVSAVRVWALPCLSAREWPTLYCLCALLH